MLFKPTGVTWKIQFVISIILPSQKQGDPGDLVLVPLKPFAKFLVVSGLAVLHPKERGLDKHKEWFPGVLIIPVPNK